MRKRHAEREGEGAETEKIRQTGGAESVNGKKRRCTHIGSCAGHQQTLNVYDNIACSDVQLADSPKVIITRA